HSVFCAHGAGFTVNWRDVDSYKHLEADIDLQGSNGTLIPKVNGLARRYSLSDSELEAIMLREFGPIKRRKYVEPKTITASDGGAVKKPIRKKTAPTKRMLLIDGYNVIYSWKELRSTAELSLDKAREELMDIMSNYVAFTKTELILVFDAYQVKDGVGSEFVRDGYRVVFTKREQTADAYIERVMRELGPDYNIKVVTGDRLLQYSAVHSGILRMTAAELEDEIASVGNMISEFARKLAEKK
ncbi:MAG: NYN domain-containing protein, partial [Clostridia bacterium]|nr:NYN domain-containing protein [Clostridia bacterium]